MRSILSKCVLVVAAACFCGAIVNFCLIVREDLFYVSHMNAFRQVELGMDRFKLEGLLNANGIGATFGSNKPGANARKYIFEDLWWTYTVDVDNQGVVIRKNFVRHGPHHLF